MNKKQVDTLISNMKKAGIVTRNTGWQVEGIRDTEMNVQYVGITLDDEWDDILDPSNNLLLKFIINRSNAQVEFYLANSAPFYRITSHYFQSGDKWETILGEFKRRLRRDKEEFINRSAKITNIYKGLEPHLK